MRHYLLLASCAALCLWTACTHAPQASSSCTQAGEIIASSQTAVANTRQGRVAGYLENGMYIYKGIPYAKAERFMAPEAPDSWEGIRSSRAYGPTCPQGARAGWNNDEMAFAYRWDDGFPGEDCLRLNIWTPALKDGRKRPVMVWLHGGG